MCTKHFVRCDCLQTLAVWALVLPCRPSMQQRGPECSPSPRVAFSNADLQGSARLGLQPAALTCHRGSCLDCSGLAMHGLAPKHLVGKRGCCSCFFRVRSQPLLQVEGWVRAFTSLPGAWAAGVRSKAQAACSLKAHNSLSLHCHP